ncbi:MAG: sigma-70 family RNA polymerase sigma factor [Hyphomicrobiaceae bacterium]
MRRLRAADRQAAETLVRVHSRWMLALAFRLTGDSSLAQDCVQESFLNAFRKIDTFESRSTLKTWLHRIVVNATLMKLRSRRRANEQSIDDLLPEFDSNDCRLEAPWKIIEQPDALLERSETATIVRAMINQLPENYRLVLLLRDIEEMSTQEVAEALETTQTAVKLRLHRARAALKKLLEPIMRGER